MHQDQMYDDLINNIKFYCEDISHVNLSCITFLNNMCNLINELTYDEDDVEEIIRAQYDSSMRSKLGAHCRSFIETMHSVCPNNISEEYIASCVAIQKYYE